MKFVKMIDAISRNIELKLIQINKLDNIVY